MTFLGQAATLADSLKVILLMPVVGMATAGPEDRQCEWISMRSDLRRRDHTGLAVSLKPTETLLWASLNARQMRQSLVWQNWAVSSA